MPDQLAHYLFARRVWAELDAPLRRRIDADSPAFRAGSFGPDPLFNDPHPRRRAEGFALHRNPGREALERMRDGVRMQLPLAAEYAAGFFTHYALDRLCHPELKAMHARGDARHLAVESAVDRRLYLEGQMDLPRRIPLGHELCRAAVEMYHSLTPRQYRADVQIYWAMRRMVVLQAGTALAALPGRLKPAWDGLIPRAEPVAGTRHGMEFVLDTLHGNVKPAARQLELYFTAMEQDLPLDAWTEPDFAGTEHAAQK